MDEETRKRIRMLVEVYYDVQDVRIRTMNRLRQVGMVEGVNPEHLKRLEKEISKWIEREIKDIPVVKEYLSGVKGIGPVLTAGLISTFDVSKAEHPSSFWRYAGLHTENGKAPKRRRGEKAGWNPKARTLAWRVGRNLLMSRNTFYTGIYESAKSFERAKLNNPEVDATRCPLYASCVANLKKAEKPPCRLHIHMRAFRKMVKHFLADLHINWRRIEGLPVSKPYGAK